MINVFPHWAEEAAEAASALTLRRVVSQEKGMYRIAGPEGEQAACLSGKFRLGVETASEYPVVGDYVLVDASRGELAVIKRVLPRKSLFVRKAGGQNVQNRRSQQISIPCSSAWRSTVILICADWSGILPSHGTAALRRSRF